MKCQSDYDSEEQALVRQADECVQEWWEAESPSTNDRPPDEEEAEPALGTVGTEAIRRGLLKQVDPGGLCISCPEGDE